MRNTPFIQYAYLWLFITAVFVGAGMGVVSSASAQGTSPEADHLKCYQVLQDTNPQDKAIVDLFNQQFGKESECTLLIKASFFCAPTEKFSVTNTEGNDPRGLELQSDFLCYKVQCDKRDKQQVLVDDQFGQRLITIRDARMLCTPTRKTTTPPLCGQNLQCNTTDSCADPNTTCRPSATGACVCQ